MIVKLKVQITLSSSISTTNTVTTKKIKGRAARATLDWNEGPIVARKTLGKMGFGFSAKGSKKLNGLHQIRLRKSNYALKNRSKIYQNKKELKQRKTKKQDLDKYGYKVKHKRVMKKLAQLNANSDDNSNKRKTNSDIDKVAKKKSRKEIVSFKVENREDGSYLQGEKLVEKETRIHGLFDDDDGVPTWFCGVVTKVAKRLTVAFTDDDLRSNLSCGLKLCDCNPDERLPIFLRDPDESVSIELILD